MPGGLRSNKGGNLSTRGGGLAFDLDFKIEGVDRTETDFKAIRTRINTVLRDTVVEFGQRELVAPIRTRFPVKDVSEKAGLAAGAMAKSIYVKRDRTDVAIASRLTGSKNRAVGWIDFGGTRDYVTETGRRVTDSRPRRGTRAILTTIDAKRPGLDRRLLDEMIQMFHREGFDVS